MCGFLIIRGGFQVACPGLDGLFAEELCTVFVVDLVSSPAAWFDESLLPVGLDDSQV